MYHARKLPVSILLLSVAVLYFAKEILVPLALAILFSFLLTPQIRSLERRAGGLDGFDPRGSRRATAPGRSLSARILPSR